MGGEGLAPADIDDDFGIDCRRLTAKHCAGNCVARRSPEPFFIERHHHKRGLDQHNRLAPDAKAQFANAFCGDGGENCCIRRYFDRNLGAELVSIYGGQDTTKGVTGAGAHEEPRHQIDWRDAAARQIWLKQANDPRHLRFHPRIGFDDLEAGGRQQRPAA